MQQCCRQCWAAGHFGEKGPDRGPSDVLTVTVTGPQATTTPAASVTWRLYYYAGAQRVAERVLTSSSNKLYYLHSDHLGSTSAVTCGNTACGTVGTVTARQYYYPFGSVRPGGTGTLPTDRTFTGQTADASTGLMYYVARYYDPLTGRFISADTIVPQPGNPQALNRYAYALGNPLKYTDPDGHNPILFGLIALGAAYVSGRLGWEVAASSVPLMYRGTRDVLGGALVTDASEAITAQAAQQSIDPALVAAVLRHESPAGERRIFTFLPMTQPGAAANLVETLEARIRTGGALGYASIGPAQMQLRRAEMLEQLGYVTARGSTDARIQALLGRDTSVEYVAGMLHYLSDQLGTVPGFSQLSSEYQQRLILIGYNQGWENLLANINEFGLEDTADLAKYDDQTLDEYLRWLAQSGSP